ncbi:hypothetical protein LX15_000814 [Streptoalloteichus tenebrarius]|uniref:DUF8129 domain-containing protein n=1 Tax=Streptoalloteichus tenebrarius (strain ATCC 17920 / DSM 40477 / JCM 4838 / CBS 697.72 / NBRC 16177 / NCIMB 11028 / NRRL B-12390 / A12253. 1 / ISP 5477) TaxID=1933 RepID=A0ABT1HNP5_STRSD|nr:hypothetical protein [Streptoalloteichus tenebrarius]MCP2257129.1 hypothetical protein [Streptoalloteichus tenebrarius]BFE98761.1 hypothetical protein GCM10020241_04370 [Streptoalloteichus tenebrarius]
MASEDQAPLPHYDELTLDDLRHRIRSLDEDALSRLLDYEREHANRVPVVQIMTTRLDELRSGAQPSPGEQQETQPAPHTRGGSPVGKDTAAEPMHPPPHGVPGMSPRHTKP